MEILRARRGQLETAETDNQTDAVEDEENEAEISSSHGRIEYIYILWRCMGNAGFFGGSPTKSCGDPKGSPQDSQLPDSGCRNPVIRKSRVIHAEVLSETRTEQYIVKILFV